MNTITYKPIRLFPAAENRQRWETVKDNKSVSGFIDNVISQADETLTGEIIHITASAYIQFHTQGNRSNFEKLYTARRISLENLVLAEALTYQGKYLNKIVDYIWAVLNEPSWCAPAHDNLHGSDVLPDCRTENVDLFSASTAMTLSATLMLLEKELTEISPNLVKRLRNTLLERAVLNIEENLEHYWWAAGKNNWTPWICSNLLNTAVIVLEDSERLTRYANALKICVDRYIEQYSEDGCCDEGASYFFLSPARMGLFGETLYQSSSGKVNIFKKPKIKRMGEFIADCWINQNNFTAFADCSAKIMTCNSHLRMYAQHTRSTKMMNFCDNCTQSEKVEPWDAVIINLYRLFYPYKKNTAQNERADFIKYYDKKEMIFAKQEDFYIALKGGHNNENHNHNDIGQFVIYYQNEPVIIDIGAETYTRFTFSEHRYLIDSINHRSHNIIEFGGVGQKEGETHKAENFQFTKNTDSFKVTMELKGCYPETAGIISYTRDFVFSSKTGITISDSWQTNSEKSIKLFLFSTNKITNGKLGRLNFECNHDHLTQKYPVHDERMRKSWGTMLYKTEIYSTQISNNGNLIMKINV